SPGTEYGGTLWTAPMCLQCSTSAASRVSRTSRPPEVVEAQPNKAAASRMAATLLKQPHPIGSDPICEREPRKLLDGGYVVCDYTHKRGCVSRWSHKRKGHGVTAVAPIAVRGPSGGGLQNCLRTVNAHSRGI